MKSPDFLAQRACPHCQGMPLAQASVQAAKPAETMPFGDISNAWRGMFHDPCFFSYYRCANCRQLFASPYLTEATLDALYKEMDDNVHSGDAMSSEQTQHDYCDMAAKYLPEARSYGEIGPDIGTFLRAAHERYKLERAFLFEPNRAVWPQLQDAAKGTRSEVFSTIDASGDAVPDSSLDMIVAVHVLDHLLMPAQMLQWVYKKLSPNGIAVFIVHDERSLLARVMGTRWPAYCLQHPQLYNPKSLARALTAQGFNVKKVLRTPNRFPLGYLASHALYALTKKHISLDWLSLPVKVKLGNIMAIASHKE